MGAIRTALARARARSGVLVSIAAVVLLLSGLGTGIVDALAGSTLAGLREGLAAASGQGGAARWQIRLSKEPETQAEVAASVLDRLLVPYGASWSRSVQTAPVDAVLGDLAFGAVLLADEGAAARSELVSGAWPDAPDAAADAAAADAVPATLHADAAGALGLAVGDVVELADAEGPRRLLVVGTWQPDDPSDAAWFGEPVIATGAAGEGLGPFLVDDDALVDLPAATIVRWTALADATSMTPERAAGLRAALPNIEPALRNEAAIGADGLSALGGLGTTLDRLLAGLGAVRAIAPLPLLLLAFAGFAAVDRLSALLGASRRGETVLLRARGASASRLARDTAVEVLVLGIPAAALGAAGAEALLTVARPGEARTWPIAALVASVTVIGTLVLVAGRAWRDARRPVVRSSGDEVGRMPRTALAGGVVVVAVAAAVSLWQFRLYGSPLVASASGTLEVDPVGVLAPVLVLLALSLAALGLSRPIGVVLERLAARRPDLIPSLPMRQLARRAGLYASASLVTMLAVAGLTLAAAFAGSWQSFDRAAAAVATGADVRVAFAGRDVVHGADPLALGEPFADIDGVTESGPVFRGEARIGSDPVTIVAAPAASLAELGVGIDDTSGLDRLAESGEAAAPAVPTDATAVEADVRVTAPAGTPGTVAVSAWVLGAGGEASRLPAGSFEVASGGGTAHAELPESAGIRLLGFEATLSGSQGEGAVTVAVDEAGVVGGHEDVIVDVTGTVELSTTRPSGRIPAHATGSAGERPVPVLLGSALAERIQAQAGDPLAFRILTGGADVDAVVAGVVDTVPVAGDDGVLADLGALSRAAFDAGSGVPEYTERWLSAADPDRVAGDIERARTTALTASTQADASSSSLIGPAVAALWVGAVGALLFGLVAVVALVAALGRARFGEVVVLRVLGTPARTQAWARFAELVAAITAAAAMGIAVGAIAALATAGDLARASVAGAPAALVVGWEIDIVPWAVALVVFLAAAAAIGAAAAAAVARGPARTGLREDE